ncbi:MAG: hypothetical protein LAT54_09975 [Cryomorphaceae bacterium]|nr:hypothetical protein [Cryomorphaceae bacterium]
MDLIDANKQRLHEDLATYRNDSSSSSIRTASSNGILLHHEDHPTRFS